MGGGGGWGGLGGTGGGIGNEEEMDEEMARAIVIPVEWDVRDRERRKCERREGGEGGGDGYPSP